MAWTFLGPKESLSRRHVIYGLRQRLLKPCDIALDCVFDVVVLPKCAALHSRDGTLGHPHHIPLTKPKSRPFFPPFKPSISTHRHLMSGRVLIFEQRLSRGQALAIRCTPGARMGNSVPSPTAAGTAHHCCACMPIQDSSSPAYTSASYPSPTRTSSSSAHCRYLRSLRRRVRNMLREILNPPKR
ncbi:hypothetical protein FA95DRAFT_805675 [Auriscalpium vulgare]|uniref:Uncharacterized protein n=1 Tax=Auriscalpium vulgare TaxID=40419 RepID=A0ACB8RBE0_9AGAM|nr:hypothetical protein FA95DRAFT_805675 [Auriscalpium vulgare]